VALLADFCRGKGQDQTGGSCPSCTESEAIRTYLCIRRAAAGSPRHPCDKTASELAPQAPVVSTWRGWRGPMSRWLCSSCSSLFLSGDMICYVLTDPPSSCLVLSVHFILRLNVWTTARGLPDSLGPAFPPSPFPYLIRSRHFHNTSSGLLPWLCPRRIILMHMSPSYRSTKKVEVPRLPAFVGCLVTSPAPEPRLSHPHHPRPSTSPGAQPQRASS
jgi:hypothetical protein